MEEDEETLKLQRGGEVKEQESKQYELSLAELIMDCSEWSGVVLVFLVAFTCYASPLSASESILEDEDKAEDLASGTNFGEGNGISAEKHYVAGYTGVSWLFFNSPVFTSPSPM